MTLMNTALFGIETFSLEANGKLQLAQSGRAQLQEEQRQQRKVKNPKVSNVFQTNLFFCFIQEVEYSLEYDTLLQYSFV
jgi:hypothetical protein